MGRTRWPSLGVTLGLLTSQRNGFQENVTYYATLTTSCMSWLCWQSIRCTRLQASTWSGCQILRPAQECPLYYRRQKETECCEFWKKENFPQYLTSLMLSFGGKHLVITAKLCDFGQPSSQCYNL